MSDDLTDRQRREIEYHRNYAHENRKRAFEPVSLDVVQSSARRWWNAYWSTYDLLLNSDLKGKRVLVPGCGFGEDAVRIASMGAEVYAFDLSKEVIDIAKSRCDRFGYGTIHFEVMPVENMTYKSNFYDLIFCLDILHHVNIPSALKEFRRVLRPGSRIVGDELYTHGAIERLIRKSFLVDKILYPKMQSYIYQSGAPYITEDEHKIDDTELALVRNLMSRCKIKYFNIFIGRLVPDNSTLWAKTDRCLMRSLGGLGKILAGRVVFDGAVD